MCGICGLYGFRDDELLARMTRRMLRRGPDAEGLFRDGPVSLGHRRLAIIDPMGGSQPMRSADGNLALVFNGEIYNYRELRPELEARGHAFAGASDTEVLLRAYAEYGPACLERLNGEFAFAIWDRREQTLFLARDRLGIRPLFYRLRGSRFAFASDLAALLEWDGLGTELDPAALRAYLSLRYAPRGRCLLRDARQVGPGETLTLRDGRPRLARYWRPRPAPDVPPDPRGQIQGFRELLRDATRLRLRSDAPVAAYLSGGIDSAAITALMRDMLPGPVATFTIGGFGPAADELGAAAALARALGTRHTELRVGPDDFELLPQVAACMSRPVGDAITLPTWLLSRAAAREFKVVLTGEGADEILAGYVHHLAFQRGAALRRILGSRALGWGAALLGRVPVAALNAFFPYPDALGGKGRDKACAFLRALSRDDRAGQYLALARASGEADLAALLDPAWGGDHADHDLNAFLEAGLGRGPDPLRALQILDLENWLPDYTLAKQDALSMDHSLEARVPYLDHRLVEYALALPASMKTRGRATKRVLRAAAAEWTPKAAVAARKKAFYFPFARCFGPRFEDFARDVLLSRRCLERGIFAEPGLRALAERARPGELVDGKRLMCALILELWLRAHLDRATP